MEEFCPMCMKRGLKKKMKAIQINLEEAVWMCESEECIYPMDHKELEYIPRKIGETWSCYWNTYKPHRSPVTVPQTDWNFFTPPYTPRSEVSPTTSSGSSSHSNDQNRSISSYSQESTSPKLVTNNVNEDDIIIIDNDVIQVEDDVNFPLSIKNNREFLRDITNPSASNTFPVENISCTSKNLNKIASSNSNSNIKTVTTRAPTIVNIEAMNLVSVGDIKKLPGEKLILKAPEKFKSENFLISPVKETAENFVSKQNISTSSEIRETVSVKSENPAQNKPKIEVKTVKIEGLPIVTLSYEVPDFLTPVNSAIPEQEKKAESEITTKTDPVNPKRNFMASKMFQKFDFSELRRLKNLKKNASDAQNTNDRTIEIKKVAILNAVQEASVSGNHDSLPVKEISRKNVTESTNFDNFAKAFSPLSEDSKDNIISDLDSFLNDYIDDINISIDENSGPHHTDDEWLSSLLV